MSQAVEAKMREIDDAMKSAWAELDAGVLRWESIKFEYELGRLEGDESLVLAALDYLLLRVRFVGGLVSSSRTVDLLAGAASATSSAA